MGLAYLLGGKAYDFLDEHFEKSRYAKIRASFIPKLKGKILDAGCGTGRNFPYFSKSAKVIAIDNSKNMLKIAKQRASKSKAKIKIQIMDITNLEFKNNYFDDVIGTFVLCVMPKEEAKKSLKELVRVSKKGARFYFLDYVYSKNLLRSLIMRLTSFIPKLLYSIRFNSTLGIVKEEMSLKIEKVEFVYDDVVRLIVAEKVL